MRKVLPFFMLFMMVQACINKLSAQSFVKRDQTRFVLNGLPYQYIGTNYWYAPFTILQNNPMAKERIISELDFLQKNGVDNLRILASVEGHGLENGVERVQPALQPAIGEFDEYFLRGLDFVLAEMRKRKMKAVLYLSNNWEWSGGFLQYLNWYGKITLPELQKKMNWDEQRDYTSQFYSCEDCINAYLKQVKYIIQHKNTVNGIAYSKDATIMSWEIANEPRPMRPSANDVYYTFIKKAAGYIKSLDKKHLVTTGHEGGQAMDGDMTFYKKVHAINAIDYLTIHIWPKNWSWFKDETFQADFPTVIKKTKDYIEEHIGAAKQLGKPLVLEEFGLPRDGFGFDTLSTTSYRDKYYSSIFDIWQKNKMPNGAFTGLNFWSFGGMSRPRTGQIFWKKVDDYSGDPPMEEQGLNSVFDCDHSTWNIIKQYNLQK